MSSSPKRRFAPSIELLEQRELLSASGMGILVPAYQYPIVDATTHLPTATASNMWYQLDQAASKVPVTAILNPNNGPVNTGAVVYPATPQSPLNPSANGSLTADPNYVAAAKALQSSGGQALGYVYTTYGARPLNQVETDVQLYAKLFPNLNGIFVDEMDAGYQANGQPDTPQQLTASVSYYQQLYSFITKNVNPNWKVVTNPGTYLPSAYSNALVANTMVSFEDDVSAGSPTFANYNPANMPATAGSPTLANMVTGVTSATQMQAVVTQAANQHAGYIFVNDEPSGAVGYDNLPGYWAQEVTAVANALATTTTPPAKPTPTPPAPVQPTYPALSISTIALPQGTAVAAYNQQIVVSGGSGNHTLAVTAGTLPAGLQLNATTGAITGTPTTAGSFGFTVTAKDADGATASRAFSVIINPQLTMGAILVTAWDANQAGFSQIVPVIGGTNSHTFAISSGTLPTGLQLNATTGAITGTPTSAGTYNFNVTATDGAGATATRGFSITINPALSLGALAVSSWNVNQAGFSQTVPATGGTGGRSFAIIYGALPTGLQLNKATGAITGTPTVAGTFTFEIEAIDADNTYSARIYSIAINAVHQPLGFTYYGSSSGQPNQWFYEAVTVTGGTGPLTISVGKSLPPGLSLYVVGNSVVICGYPTAARGGYVGISVTDASGASNGTWLPIWIW